MTRKLVIVSLIDRLRDLLTSADLGVDLVVIILGLVAYARRVKVELPGGWPELQWDSYATIAIVLLRRLLFVLPRWWATRPRHFLEGARPDSIPAEWPSQALGDTGMRVADEPELEKVSAFAASIYLPKHVSRRTLSERQQTYQRWRRHSARAILISEKTGGEMDGFSVMVPVREDTWLRYRHADGEFWTWSPNDLAPQPLTGRPCVYSQALFIQWSDHPQAGCRLTHLFTSHLAYLLIDVDLRAHPPVIFAARILPSSQRTLVSFGFEQSRRSAEDYPIYEFDALRVDQYGEPGHRFWNQVLDRHDRMAELRRQGRWPHP